MLSIHSKQQYLPGLLRPGICKH